MGNISQKKRQNALNTHSVYFNFEQSRTKKNKNDNIKHATITIYEVNISDKQIKTKQL